MSDKKIGRIASLDAFRGITIAGMILVNNPGSWLHVHMKIPAVTIYILKYSLRCVIPRH